MEWATMVVARVSGGRCMLVNSSERGLFRFGEQYFNHQLKHYPKGTVLNVVVRLSPKGRRMIQKVSVKYLPALTFEVI